MLLFCILVYVSNRSSLLFYAPVSGLLLSVGDTATSCFWVGCHCYSYVSFVFVFAYKFVFVFVLGLQIGLLLFLEGGSSPSLQVSCHCKQVQRCTIVFTPDVDASLQNRSPPKEKHKRQIAKLPNKLSTVGIICSSFL